MRPIRLLAALALSAVLPLAQAQQLADACHASSSFDLTVQPGSLLFDRASPAPQRIELGAAGVRVDGAAVPLNAEQEDRASLFDRHLRALLPRVRQLASRAVDVAGQALHEQTAGLGLSAQTQADLAERLRVRGAELKQRIAASNSTHDWQGAAFDQYTQQLAADLGPLVAGDLGQQAMQAALSGDLQEAAALRDKASQLATQLQPQVLARLQVLRPQVQALCPAVRQLYEDQEGLRDRTGQPLNLLHWSP